MTLTEANIAKVAPGSTVTIAALRDEAGRKTVDFYRVQAVDTKAAEWIAKPLNDATAEPVRLPLYPGYSESTGLPLNMACETPQMAWQYAAMHGFRVKALMSEPSLVAALATPTENED